MASEFRPPVTQQELDELIKDRLRRERSKERKVIIDSTEEKLQRILADLVDLYKDLDKMR